MSWLAQLWWLLSGRLWLDFQKGIQIMTDTRADLDTTIANVEAESAALTAAFTSLQAQSTANAAALTALQAQVDAGNDFTAEIASLQKIQGDMSTTLASVTPPAAPTEPTS